MTYYQFRLAQVYDLLSHLYHQKLIASLSRREEIHLGYMLYN